MICPKCRKIYPEGIEVCPECGTQLIALMGEADAPVDEDNDNISNIDVVFGTENIEGYAKFSESVSDSSADSLQEETDEFCLDGEDEAFLPDEDKDTNEFDDADENFSLSYSDDYEDNTNDDIRIFSHSTQDFDDDTDVDTHTDTDNDVYSSSQSQEHELYEEEYVVDFSETESNADSEYEEDDTYVTDYKNDEFFREFENDAELYNEPEQENTTENDHTAKGQYYKTFKQEEELRNKKNMNMLTALIFTAAVVLVIASVVCFILGSTTELTEMNIENLLFGDLL